ncbi:uncharacterized protein A4U43_C01F29480 [Asparagus officinalis]|uniref:Uncharacterized protein n=1 Tax=Asparagus officinalis TaxID=4686 RepID=A0A5P1FWW4_ASPOF|nr:uncharacterized protein A4U43_C01F29480 [Asparagus officinalis]
MAIDLINFSKMDDRITIKEAAIASLQSMEALVLILSHQSSSSSLFDCLAITDNTVSKFKKFINALDQTGHARFRRDPVQPPNESSSPLCSLVMKDIGLRELVCSGSRQRKLLTGDQKAYFKG